MQNLFEVFSRCQSPLVSPGSGTIPSGLLLRLFSVGSLTSFTVFIGDGGDWFAKDYSNILVVNVVYACDGA